MHENCEKCNTDYKLTDKNAKVYLFIEDARANHVEAVCTNCGHEETIFMTTAGFFRIMKSAKLGVTFGEKPTEEFLTRALNVWGIEVPVPAEADVPREWLRELYDDMRAFGGQS